MMAGSLRLCGGKRKSCRCRFALWALIAGGKGPCRRARLAPRVPPGLPGLHRNCNAWALQIGAEACGADSPVTFMVARPGPTLQLNSPSPSTQIRSGQAGLIDLCFYRVFTKCQELEAKEVDADACALFVMHTNPTLKLCVDLDEVPRELSFFFLKKNNEVYLPQEENHS